MFNKEIEKLNEEIMKKVISLGDGIKGDINEAGVFDNYTSVYMYFHPKKELLQILGNFKQDGKQTKKLIYNLKKKTNKDLSAVNLMIIYKNIEILISLIKERKCYISILQEKNERVNIKKILNRRGLLSDMNKFLSEY